MTLDNNRTCQHHPLATIWIAECFINLAESTACPESMLLTLLSLVPSYTPCLQNTTRHVASGANSQEGILAKHASIIGNSGEEVRHTCEACVSCASVVQLGKIIHIWQNLQKVVHQARAEVSKEERSSLERIRLGRMVQS